METEPTLSHLNARGEAHMVDVTDKAVTRRSATAGTRIQMHPQTLQRVLDDQMHKGDVLATARIAGIQAAKRCSDLIPLCHPLPLTHVEVELEPDPAGDALQLRATCALDGKTGVEMEALTAVSVAALTVYDMCKGIDKSMSIGPTRLLAKSGGRSGNWTFDDPQ